MELSTIKIALDILGNASKSLESVRKRAKTSNDAALKESISNLYDDFLDLKSIIVCLTEENAGLRMQILQGIEKSKSPKFGKLGRLTTTSLVNGGRTVGRVMTEIASSCPCRLKNSRQAVLAGSVGSATRHSGRNDPAKERPGENDFGGSDRYTPPKKTLRLRFVVRRGSLESIDHDIFRGDLFQDQLEAKRSQVQSEAGIPSRVRSKAGSLGN